MQAKLNGVEYWAFVKLECTDGVTRLGFVPEDEAIEETVVEKGLHYNYAIATIELKAAELGIEVFDAGNFDYEQTTY